MVNFGCVILLLLPSTLFLPTGAALEVTAPDQLTFEIGEKATLPCTFKVSSPFDMKYLAVFWLLQKEDILRYDNKGYRKPTDPRLLLKKEYVERGDISLHIDKVTVMDGGTYTCRVIYSPNHVTKDIKISVYALPTISSLEMLDQDDGSKRVVCGVTGFYPPNVTVTLLSDGKVMSFSELTQQQTNSDGTYNVTRATTLNPEEKPRRLECRVQHESLLQPLQKELNLQYEDTGDNNTVIIALIAAAVILIICVIIAVWLYLKKKGLSLNEIQGPKRWMAGETLTLYCTTSDWDPNTKVKWTILDKDGYIAKISEDPSQDKEEEQPLMARAYQMKNEKKDKKGKKGVCDLASSLTFIPTLSHLNSTVTCEVKRGKNTELKTFKPEKLYARPQFLEPAEFTICGPGEVQLGINLRRFYPGTIDITWSYNKGESPNTKKPECTMNSDKLYDMKSEQRFPADLFKDPDFKVHVSWKHESMDKEESREFSVKDFPWSPQLEDIDIVKPSGSRTVKLTCKIHSFFPDLPTLKWIEKKTDGQEVDVTNNNKYTISNTTSKADDHTLSCNASLSFEKSHDSEDKVEYICRVEHPCLKSPIQSRTGLLQLEDLHSFVVQNIQGPQSWVVGEKVTLYCAASYCNKDVSVLWILKEGDGTPQEVSELPPEKHGTIPSEYAAVRDKTEKSDIEDLHNITSSLSFMPSITKHRNLTLSCKLSSGGKTKEQSFHLKHLYAKPQFLEPAEFTICSPGEVQLGINLRSFYPETIDITWSCNKGKSQDTKIPEYTVNYDKTYNSKSEQRFPEDLFKDPGFRVCVSWKHESMDKQESREFSVKDFPWPPQIEDIDVVKSPSSSTVKLICKIHSFFLDLLTVKWIEKKTDGQEVDVTNNNKYVISNTSSKADGKHTLSCNASLSFEKSHDSEDKVEYICRVEHPCLKSPIQSRTGLLQLEGLHSFIVHNIQGPQTWVVGEKVTLYCAASNCKKDVSVLWILKEGDGTPQEVSELPPEKHETIPPAEYTAVRDKTEKSDIEELLNITSSLSFVPSITKHRNLTLSCKLSSEGKTKEKSFQLKHLHAKPQFLEPAEFTICSPGEVQLGINLRKFYPETIDITWSCNKGKSPDTKIPEYTVNYDKTCNTKSEQRFPADLFKDLDFRVNVSWKHESMDKQESREFSVKGRTDFFI
uniref:Ig-like domain-containing protein n=1 Tax=Leptobrachium leishanense TaxID=445787 RepID=A0A8C5QVF2_9ANUR